METRGEALARLLESREFEKIYFAISNVYEIAELEMTTEYLKDVSSFLAIISAVQGPSCSHFGGFSVDEEALSTSVMTVYIHVKDMERVERYDSVYEHVYMRAEVNSNRFEISNRFEMSFRLHGNFTESNLEISNRFQKLSRLHGDFTVVTIARLYCTCANDIF